MAKKNTSGRRKDAFSLPQHDAEIQRLIEDSARAEELFPIEELEEFADAWRAQQES